MKALIWFLALGLAVAGQAIYPAVTLAADDSHADSDEAASEVPAGQTARYLVTFIKSNTSTTALRTASVVTVTNQGTATCNISVDWFAGLSTAIVTTTNLAVSAGHTVDFCSRTIPSGITTCNATASPSQTFLEGRARVASTNSTTLNNCHRIGVSARVYYTQTTSDSPVSAITDSNIVRVNSGNNGD